MSNTFKRLAVGQNFSHNGANWRKINGRHAYKLKASGRGETHAGVKFSRSAAVVPF